jgi:hypothetical protein
MLLWSLLAVCLKVPECDLDPDYGAVCDALRTCDIGSGGGCLLSAATWESRSRRYFQFPNDTVARQLSDGIADDAYMTTTDPQLQREHEVVVIRR